MKKRSRPGRAAPREPLSADEATAAPAASPVRSPTASASHERWTDRLLVAAAALVVFGRAVPYPLVPSWDDRRFLIDNPLVQQPSFASLRAIFFEPHFEAYHPLHLLSYWVDVPWFGAVGWAVRSTNLAIFVGVGWLLLAFLREIGIPRWPALLATLAFVLHPIQVELVVWGTGRKDGLADLLALAAWLCHLRAKHLTGRAAWASRGLFLLACLAKTSAVPLPLAMFALDVALRRRGPREAAIWQAPSAAIALGLGALTVTIWSANDMIRPLAQGESSASLVLISLTHALATAVWPSSTSPLYALVGDQPPGTVWVLGGAAAVGLLAAMSYRWRAESWARWVGAGLAVFIALFLPVANLLPTYFHFQDRHLSLPFVGLAMIFAAILTLASGESGARPAPSAALGMAAVAVLALGLRTAQYEAVWSSDLRLWSHATATHPRAFFAWIKLGEVRRDLGHFDGAIAAYATAIEIEPTARLAYAGMLMAMVVRDEHVENLPGPSRGEAIAERYARHADRAELLREDATEMLEQGYRQAALFVLSRSLDISPVSDERLERAAQIQLALDHEWVARFYVGRMSRRPILPPVARFFDEERERLGLVPASTPPAEDDLPPHGEPIGP